MKKMICLILALTFVLTGCSLTTEKIDNYEIKNAMNGKTVENGNETNKSAAVIPYSEDDEIAKYLANNLYLDIKNTGYTLYPNNEYFRPEYIPVNGELKVVYLSLKQKYSAIENPFVHKDANLSGCEDGDSSVNCQVAKAVGSGVYYKFEKDTNNGFTYDVMVAINGQTQHIWLDSRPSVDNFNVNMGQDGQLNVMGVGSGNSNSWNSFGSLLSDSFGSVDFGLSQNNTAFNTSEYKEVKESSFLSVKTNPLSTFAADVDTASYTNFRNIMNSYMKDETGYYRSYETHDVRIEEMLNYFNYNYETSDDVFTVNAEISTTPWNKDTQLLVLNVATKELPEEENKGSNLVFLIDTSGSMDDEDKLPLVKESLVLLVNELTENDTISIVTYAGHESVIIDGATGKDKEKILNAINMLSAYGSTNGEGGINKAYEIAERYQKDHSNSRIIMCSDGDLNVGISSESELIKLVEQKRKTGIYLSVLGFGTGNYKDNKMEALANNGNGNYYYIDNIKEGHKVLVEDLMSTLVTIADDVKFQVEFNPAYIKGYRKIGYENRDMADEDFHDDTKDGGEIGYGDSVTIVYEIVPVDSEKEIAGSSLKYQNTQNSDLTDWLTVSVRYKNHGKKESNLVEYIVDENNYSEEPSKNWKFVSNVVGFGLIINDSEYKEDLTIDDVVSGLQELKLTDRDKIELLSLAMAFDYYFDN